MNLPKSTGRLFAIPHLMVVDIEEHDATAGRSGLFLDFEPARARSKGNITAYFGCVVCSFWIDFGDCRSAVSKNAPSQLLRGTGATLGAARQCARFEPSAVPVRRSCRRSLPGETVDVPLCLEPSRSSIMAVILSGINPILKRL
jgi:hypothetical protein